tara:strand:- start:2734 stop:3114 length:381 start_codon:yes stop_codon:yes gene_type:complete
MSDTETQVPEEPIVKVTKRKGKAAKRAAKKAVAQPQPQPEPEPEPEPEVVAPTKKARKKAKTVVAPEPVKESTSRGTKMTDDQKTSLSDHMKSQEGTITELKSQRMKLMSRMRKGMTLEEARKDIA